MLDPLKIQSALREQDVLVAGIDYSLGKANFDPTTGIHYGVISINEVLQAWADSSEGHYVYTCPYCGHLLKKGLDAKRCGSCWKPINSDKDFYDMEPDSYIVEGEGYFAEQTSDDSDIFILKSPYFTRSRYCSPCAPGAGDIMSPTRLGVKTYCFDGSWFDSGKAPYPVFDVKTGKEV